jgi:hypothetical protein
MYVALVIREAEVLLNHIFLLFIDNLPKIQLTESSSFLNAAQVHALTPNVNDNSAGTGKAFVTQNFNTFFQGYSPSG